MMECANEHLDHDPLNMTAAELRQSLIGLQTRDLITIDLYVHILADDADTVETTGLSKQIDFLQESYNKWGFRFQHKSTTLAKVDFFTSTAFLRNGLFAKNQIDLFKTALHQGDYQTLNVYLVQGLRFGYCTFPWRDNRDIDEHTFFLTDGCAVPLHDGLSANSTMLTHESMYSPIDYLKIFRSTDWNSRSLVWTLPCLRRVFL